MKLTERLDAIGSERLSTALRTPEIPAETRMAAWAVLSLDNADPLALWNFCEAHGLRGLHPADTILDWHEQSSPAEQMRIRALLQTAKEQTRMAVEGRDPHSWPEDREYWRGRDFETKVLVAFGGGKEVEERCVADAATGETRIIRRIGAKRTTLTLQFMSGQRSRQEIFRSAAHLLGEYANPDGALRRQGFGQSHFIDALDRHFAQQRWWKDVYEEPSTVGWLQERGKDALGNTVYAKPPTRSTP